MGRGMDFNKRKMGFVFELEVRRRVKCQGLKCYQILPHGWEGGG